MLKLIFGKTSQRIIYSLVFVIMMFLLYHTASVNLPSPLSKYVVHSTNQKLIDKKEKQLVSNKIEGKSYQSTMNEYSNQGTMIEVDAHQIDDLMKDKGTFYLYIYDGQMKNKQVVQSVAEKDNKQVLMIDGKRLNDSNERKDIGFATMHENVTYVKAGIPGNSSVLSITSGKSKQDIEKKNAHSLDLLFNITEQ